MSYFEVQFLKVFFSKLVFLLWPFLTSFENKTSFISKKKKWLKKNPEMGHVNGVKIF